MFALPRSSWQDYNTKLISKGGGIFPRSAKSIALTPEIKQLTGLKADRVTPFELINALLKAPSDLLWFGGIGTYIKATSESHADADDRANDAIRVNAPQVGARVIGEGANLGVTQRARIELSARGVKLNSDAVDNSAGVDCSDHEVNIKIALGAVVGAGDMTGKQRNTLLAKMTDEVGELVLQTNYHQTLAISMAESRASSMLEEHARFMRALEAQDLLNREVELLPSEEELSERRQAGRGLTRPELSVLVAYAKITIFSELTRSKVPDDPYMERLLIDYMPGPIRAKYKPVLQTHRLRREIIATVAANAFVNEAGPSLANRLCEETGASVAEGGGDPDRDAPGAVGHDRGAEPAAVAGRRRWPNHWPGNRALRSGRGTDRRLRRGGDHRFLEKAAGPAQRRVGQGRGTEGAGPEDRRAGTAGRGLRCDRGRRRAGPRGRRRIALGRLMADLRSQQSAIGAAALGLKGAKPGAASIAKWAEKNADATKRADRLIAELRAGGDLSVAKLAVASSQLRAVSGQ
jgi:NAD-specific glutamate dehydrogenase